MTRKRKRATARPATASAPSKALPAHLTIIARFYPLVLTLPEYLKASYAIDLASTSSKPELVDKLSRFIVGIPDDVQAAKLKDPTCSLASYTSSRYDSIRTIVHRAQLAIFQELPPRATNVLTLGYKRPDDRVDSFNALAPGQQGLINIFPNTLVTTILTWPEWTYLLDRVGDHAFFDMLAKLAIFVPVGEGEGGCFVQMCGRPVYETGEVLAPPSEPPGALQEDGDKPAKRKRKRQRTTLAPPPPLPAPAPMARLLAGRVGTLSRFNSAASTVLATQTQALRPSSSVKLPARSLSDINFVRSRIFYARSIRSKRGWVELGLPFVHVLNRSAKPAEVAKSLRPSFFKRPPPVCPGDPKADQTFAARRARHLLKYVFPRQFGLHNVFTSPKDPGTAQPFSDYTMREAELRSLGRVRTPNRLREALRLVAIIAKRHDKINYRAILDRCCPSRLPRTLSEQDKLQIADDLSEMIAQEEERRPRFANYAVPASGQVAHFVKTVLKTLVPKAFFGTTYNMNKVLRHVGRFVTARRFETINLHIVCQGLRTNEIDWLLPPSTKARQQRAPPQESLKRLELLHEFLYWLFDSVVIPLLRTTFYATESAAFRNRVLYFRQDDWHAISAPVLDRLKSTLFEPLSRAEALSMMSTRKLGYSHVRLLPKETGVRPIVNLRRRSTRAGVDKRESQRLGQSINYILRSAFHILTFEKKRAMGTDVLGSSVFGPNDIYTQLKGFQKRVRGQKLYFVKTDVKAAFDTIEQDKLVGIVERVLREEAYLIHRYARVEPGPKGVKRTFVRGAQPDSEHGLFLPTAAKLAKTLRQALLVDTVQYRSEPVSRILALLRHHIQGNLVKLGADYYRQRRGIPQGSSLSTLLCAFFYADMEAARLAPFRHDRAMLLRYTDDFLYVTTSKSEARRFCASMLAGFDEWGCAVSREKTVLSFDSPGLARCVGPMRWCGVAIDTKTLSVRPDMERYRDVDMADTLTVEHRRPGQALAEKMRQSIKNRLHILYLDTALNPLHVVHDNIFTAFVVAAHKFAAYVPRSFKAPFLLRCIRNLVSFTANCIARKAIAAKRLRQDARCLVESRDVYFLGYFAFLRVLPPRRFEALLAELRLLTAHPRRALLTTALKSLDRTSRIFNH